MAPRRTHYLLGAHRGGTQYVDDVTPAVTRAAARFVVIDRKEERVTRVVERARKRFSSLDVIGLVADAREAIRNSDRTDVVITALDSVSATAEVILSRRTLPTVFQILGRTGGGTLAPRFAVAGLVDDEGTQQEALGLLAGFHSLNAAASSSRAFTHAGDPLTSLLLRPLREAAAAASIQYVASSSRMTEDRRLTPLTFILPEATLPLTVRPFQPDDRFSVQKEQALDAMLAIGRLHRGLVAAVALVSIEEHTIDVHLISSSRSDTRRVDRVIELRRPKAPQSAPVAMSD